MIDHLKQRVMDGFERFGVARIGIARQRLQRPQIAGQLFKRLGHGVFAAGRHHAARYLLGRRAGRGPDALLVDGGRSAPCKSGGQIGDLAFKMGGVDRGGRGAAAGEHGGDLVETPIELGDGRNRLLGLLVLVDPPGDLGHAVVDGPDDVLRRPLGKRVGRPDLRVDGRQAFIEFGNREPCLTVAQCFSASQGIQAIGDRIDARIEHVHRFAGHGAGGDTEPQAVDACRQFLEALAIIDRRMIMCIGIDLVGERGDARLDPLDRAGVEAGRCHRRHSADRTADLVEPRVEIVQSGGDRDRAAQGDLLDGFGQRAQMFFQHVEMKGARQVTDPVVHVLEPGGYGAQIVARGKRIGKRGNLTLDDRPALGQIAQRVLAGERGDAVFELLDLGAQIAGLDGNGRAGTERRRV